MRLLAKPVELTFPCDDRLMRLARLTAGGIAAVCGLPLDETEDLRLVVDEVCATLFAACDEGPVHVGFRIDGGSLVIDGSTRTSIGPLAEQDDDARSALGRQILDVLTDSHNATRDGDGLTVTALIALRGAGVG
jgi:hypothetical protein